MAEANVLVDAELGSGVAQVLEDRRSVGDRLGGGPRLEAVAEGVHVAVRAHARVAEQIPGAAQVIAAFEDQIGPIRAQASASVAGADAGDARTHHQ